MPQPDLKKKIRIGFLLLSFVFILIIILPFMKLGLLVFKKRAEEAPATYKMRPVKRFGFSEDSSLREWEEKIFKDKVVYRIEKDEPLSFVRATSKAAASALYYKIRLDAKTKHPLVNWKWRVREFPFKKNKESLETKDEDDFAARVYVIFPARFFTNSKVLEYIWAETLPVGMVGTSPYSKNIKLIVLRSSLIKDKEWVAEDRDIRRDYLNVFGRLPEYDIGAVAFMTNAEHTGTSADAMYDEIRLGYKEGADKNEERRP